MVWSDFELDSARTKFIDDNPGGRQPGRGAAVAHKEDQGVPNSWSSIGAPRRSTDTDRSS